MFSKATKPQISLKKFDVTDIYKSSNLKGLTVNLVLDLFKQCSRVQTFLLFCRHVIICVFLGDKASNFVKKIGRYRCLQILKFEGFDRESRSGPF